MPLPIECDTDGIFFQWHPSLDIVRFKQDVNEHIENIISEWAISNDKRLEWKLKSDHEMAMDTDLYEVGWFYKQKTYILLTACKKCNGTGENCLPCKGTGDDLTIKGGAFNSKRECLMIDTIRDKLANLRIHKGDISEVKKVINMGMAIQDWSVNDLMMRITLSKPIKEYSASYEGVQIALRAEERLKIPAQHQYQYEYVFSNEIPYEVLPLDKDQDRQEIINWYKYREKVAKIATRLGYGQYAWPLVPIPPLNELTEVEVY